MAAPHSLSSDIDTDASLASAKRVLRREVRLRARAGRAAAGLASDGRDAAIVRRLAGLIGRHDPATLAGVWPLPDEPDLRALLRDLHASGRMVVLPVVASPGEALGFARWHPDVAMQGGAHGTSHPVASGLAGSVPAPDLILVPLVAFDRRCNRLGRGGGFYDRTLAGLGAAFAVGFAHAEREVAAVPTGPLDVPLDAIVTETETILRPSPTSGAA